MNRSIFYHAIVDTDSKTKNLTNGNSQKPTVHKSFHSESSSPLPGSHVNTRAVTLVHTGKKNGRASLRGIYSLRFAKTVNPPTHHLKND